MCDKFRTDKLYFTRQIDYHDVDKKYVPEELTGNSEEVLADVSDQCMELSLCLEASPVVPVKRKRISDLSDRSVDAYKRKYERMKKSLKLKFAKIAAPGQEEELLAVLSSSEDSDQEDVVPDDLCALYERYKVSDAIGKVIFISLIDHNKYSGKQIMSIFKCNNWAWRKGVTLSKEPKFKLPQKVPFKRNRFNETKCEHFLE